MKPYDPACRELAEHFLQHTPGALADDGETIDALAVAIQDAIEDWLRDVEDEREAKAILTPREDEPV